MTREQAILFIDGSNFYHSARSIGIATGTLNYQALAHKLVNIDPLMSGKSPGIFSGGKRNF